MDKKIRGIAGLLFALSLGGWIFGALSSQADAEAKKPLYSGPITIGAETWPGYLLLFVARDLGYFKDAGLNVEIKRYLALGELSKDYVAGKMQGRANLTLDMVNESLQGLDHKAVLTIDYSNGADAIIAHQAIATLKDARGKKVAYEPDTLEEFFIVWALKEAGLGLTDIQSIAATPEESARKLAAGESDVAVSHEPYLSKILGEGPFHRIYSSADAPGLITDVLTFRTDFLKSYPETVQAIVETYFRALKFFQEHPRKAHEILAKEFGDSPESVARQLQGLKLLDEVDNQTTFTFSGGLQSLYGNLRQIGEFVLSHRAKASLPLDTDQLVEPRFIRQVMKEKRAVQ